MFFEYSILYFWVLLIFIVDIQEFIKLDNKDRFLASMKGTFVSERQDGPRYALLYHLGNFFVEIEINVARNEIRRIRPFNSSFLLEPYLAELSLDIIT